MKTVTLLIPCYNEEKSLPKLYDALIGMMAQNALYEWKVLFPLQHRVLYCGSKQQT